MKLIQCAVLIALALVVSTKGEILHLTAATTLLSLHVDNIHITPLPNSGNWFQIDSVDLDDYSRLIAIGAFNIQGGCSGILVTANHANYTFVSSSTRWRCASNAPAGWELLGFDDSSWTHAHQVLRNGALDPACSIIPVPGMSQDAWWIWTPRFVDGDNFVVCRGYTPICDYAPCSNGGTCQENHPEYCRCLSTFTGRFCETPFDPCGSEPCLNGGECVVTDEGYMCRCPDGTSGINCESDITDCASEPCLNGGTCTFIAGGGYDCHCVDGYTGNICETDINECETSVCENNGTCIDLIGDYGCQCLPGYTGPTCAIDVNECESHPCLYAGACHDEENGYRCECQSGYEGDRCETPIGACASNPCLNQGTCTLDGVGGSVQCLCPAGWYGQLCELNENDCLSDPCRNGGTCIDGERIYTCSCPSIYTGTNCQNVIPGCGTMMSQSDFSPIHGFWALCEIRSTDFEQALMPCSQLLVDIPHYNNSETIMAMGGSFGCYVASSRYPEDVQNACFPGFYQDQILADCISCDRMGICILAPDPPTA